MTPGYFTVIQCEAYKAMIEKEVREGDIKVQSKKSDIVDLAQVEAA